MSRALHLDFLAERPPLSRVGVALLALGVVAAALTLIAYGSIAAENARLQSRIDSFRQLGNRSLPALPANAAASKALAQEVEDANAVLAQLSLPWGELFGELESASTPEVTLLAIQPDVASGRVRVSGEAKSYATALEYVAKLESMERFANVFLTGHEVRLTSPQRPVTFTLTADWIAHR